ncbi:hypothetical protein GQ53DRAFT_717123 [Thozetella sp. PMI_491]|nr:hypothetical protein GQ53DRAFT_717123 [Thozetella sp. PMI_491]
MDVRKKARTRTGCWNCRRKKKKCDEHRPVCSNCHSKGELCEWGIRLSFRDENIETIPDSHPSMRQNSASRQDRDIKIVDITKEVIRDYWSEFHATIGLDQDLSDNTATNDSNDGDGGRGHSVAYPPVAHPPSREQVNLSPVMRTRPMISFRSGLREPTNMLTTADALESSMNSGFGNHRHDSPGSATTSRSYDMLLPPSPQAMSDIHGTAGISPEQSFAEDGIFLPGSAYLELHSVLRSHIFDTARSNYPSRLTTPSLISSHNEDPVAASTDVQRAAHTASFTGQAEQNELSSSATPTSIELTKEEEYTLWKNWVEEISPWLDKFDSNCHFGHTLPPLAGEYPHLRFSMLALSARQLERKYMERSSSASLALYQEAIHQLIPQLQTKATPVVASCVVLCVLEMMDCSPKMWRRHLDGCASLMQSFGINGFSGGLEQALFWCFARMDVCGGLISSEPTLIPPASWTPRISLSDALDQFRKAPGFDMYANLSVFLCALVLELFACNHSDTEFTRRWIELFTYIEDWYIQRPLQMLPILSQPVCRDNDYSSPFPTLLFSNPSAISGNQLYHTAALLMLQKKPYRAVLPSKTKSVLWHARRICAISISNTHHGCWTNCVQLLWVAGKVLSHHAEHRAIIDTYERIERETGWGANWRAVDLKSHWAQLDES